jgi:hypothetical protein
MKPVLPNHAPIFCVGQSQLAVCGHIALQRELPRVVSTNVDLIAVTRHDPEELTT